jgi:putative addiction module killer protein
VEAQPRRVEKYVRGDDSCPFDEWFEGIKDLAGRAQIDKRIARLRLGGLGEWRSVGEGVIELIFTGAGPGYRVYCGQDGQDLVILLGGGIKRGQQTDIERAKTCWRDYNEE